MRRVSYGGGSFPTSDQVADALVSLVATLSGGHSSQIVDIPAVSDDGQLVLVRMVVGPLSILISIPEDSPWPEPDLSDAVSSLRILTEIAAKIPGSGSLDTMAITDYDRDETGDFD